MRCIIGLLLAAAAAWGQGASHESAEKKLEARDFAGALAEYEKLIEGAPGDARAHIGRAQALSALDRVDDAIKGLDRATEAVPTDARIPYMRGLMRMRKQELDAAIADFGRAIDLNPKDGRFYRWRGDVRSLKHDYLAAHGDYDKAYEINARDLTALEKRAAMKEALRDSKGTIEDYTLLTEAAPRHPRPFQLRGFAKLQTGDFRGAIDDFDGAIYNDEKAAPAYVGRARARWALGQKEAADADAAKAVEVDPVANTFSDRGRYYFDTGRSKEAALDLKKAIEMDSTDPDDYTRFVLFLARARNGERAAAAAERKAVADGREEKDDWYAKVAAFLSGQTKEADFLASAKGENANHARELECEACWYAGAVRLLDGDAAGAKPLFERCVATDVRNFIEYGSAQATLAGLK
jgi:tetratricopeptide (TPR) repeat protein